MQPCGLYQTIALHLWCCYVGLAVAQPLYIRAASINVVTKIVAAVAAAVAAAAADIVATVSVRMIVIAAWGNVHSCRGSGLKLVAMDATIVTGLCNFELYLY